MKRRTHSTPPAGIRSTKHNRERVRDGPQKPDKTADTSASPWHGVTEYLTTLRFRRRIFGGVDEADVWRKLEKLNGLYEEALRAERVRYDTLLEQQTQASNSKGRAEDE